MRPLSARKELVEMRLEEAEVEDDGATAAGDDGLRSTVTCTSEPDELDVPQFGQKRAESLNPLPQ